MDDGPSSLALPTPTAATTDVAPRICIFGALPDVKNLGLNALLLSTLDGLGGRFPQADITIFDNGLGRRLDVFQTGSQGVAVTRLGVRVGKRLHLPENLHTMRLMQRLGGIGNPGASAVRQADVVIDLSGGDSFTDVYGPARFAATSGTKMLALEAGAPLVLPPQTYGPFEHAKSRRSAAEALRGAHAAWARGPQSFSTLRDLLGDAYDPERHHQGVDLAFTLSPSSPSARHTDWLAGVRDASRGAPLVGLNVSGLFYRWPPSSRRHRLTASYDDAIMGIARMLIDEGATVVLVPHVVIDDQACRSLAEEIGSERVHVVPWGLGAGKTKWLISHLDWFCGTRMHSTIAALSSGVPTAAIAYSPKTREVFSTCALADEVADATALTTDALIDAVRSSWDRRSEVRATLSQALPEVVAQAEAQMVAILDATESAWRGRPLTGPR